MSRQVIEIMIMAEVDCDKWIPDQRIHESELRNYLSTAVVDKIDSIQGGDPIKSEYDAIVEFEYGDLV